MTRSASACSLDLVTLALDGREFVVLLHAGPRDTWHLPNAPWRGTGTFDDTVRTLGVSLNADIAWCEQVGAVAGRSRESAPISVVFVGVTARARDAKAGAEWKRIDDLPAKLPQADRAAVASAVAHVRQRVDQAPIAFRLLPPTFTLTDLQRAYETLCGHSLHKASFRRLLAASKLVQPVGEWRSDARGRPAELYRFVYRRRKSPVRTVRFDAI